MVLFLLIGCYLHWDIKDKGVVSIQYKFIINYASIFGCFKFIKLWNIIQEYNSSPEKDIFH